MHLHETYTSERELNKKTAQSMEKRKLTLQKLCNLVILDKKGFLRTKVKVISIFNINCDQQFSFSDRECCILIFSNTCSSPQVCPVFGNANTCQSPKQYWRFFSITGIQMLMKNQDFSSSQNWISSLAKVKDTISIFHIGTF